jgi:hypothetical protein
MVPTKLMGGQSLLLKKPAVALRPRSFPPYMEPEGIYRAQKSLPVDRAISQTNPVHIIISIFLTYILILPSHLHRNYHRLFQSVYSMTGGPGKIAKISSQDNLFLG